MAEPGSELERDLLDAMLEAGIPEPEMQHRPIPRRHFRCDFAWPNAKLICEVEGGIWSRGRHVRGGGFEADCRKYGLLVAQGWRVLRVTGAMIANGEAVDLVRSCLARPVAMPVRPLPVGWPQEVVDA